MNIIVAVDRNWAIGNKGELLTSIPADHKMFRKETIGKVVVYGRKTLETFPMRQPLDQRTNIILSARPDYSVKGAETAHSVPELLELLKQYDTHDVYVIGGTSVYEQLLPYCDTCHVTKIDREYEADCYFRDLDADPAWDLTADSDEQTYFDLTYHFLRYTRRAE
ncbi:MAG: dihydrofolate reductase [Lachnospiraceae bacterium]|nr:dihydrofolate reductase [Lachnospiraceae bacterium]